MLSFHRKSKKARHENQAIVKYSAKIHFTNSLEAVSCRKPCRPHKQTISENRPFSWGSQGKGPEAGLLEKLSFCGFCAKNFQLLSATRSTASGCRSRAGSSSDGPGSWAGSDTTLSTYRARISSGVLPSSAGFFGDTTTSCLSW